MPSRRAAPPELEGLAKRLHDRLGDRGLAVRAIATVKDRAPDEQLALAFLLKFADDFNDLLRRVLADPAATSDLVFCLGSSEVVATELSLLGPGWADVFLGARAVSDGPRFAKMKSPAIDAPDRTAGAAALGRFMRGWFTRIIIADLLKLIDVAGTARAMSDLADECIRAALDFAARQMGDRAAEAGSFCVLAMGKLGARELNLSSDIDLIYLIDSAHSPRAAETAARLGEAVTEILSARCFRVDMRLRPGGRSSPLVTPLEGAIGFYQSLGETWERAALLRARPVAGALEIGRHLLSEVAPFVFRRYLDFETLENLRGMKRRIERELSAPAMVERNVKLGYGGIRELEFIVHSLTLIYGGRDPRLRIAGTIDALTQLEVLGYLSSARAKELTAAYLFLRDVEHKLQVVAGLQTHALPASETGMRALAARMGFGKQPGAVAEFSKRLKSHRDLVAIQFRETLAGGGDEANRTAPALAQAAWRDAGDPAASALRLRAMGFQRPQESAPHLELLVRGPTHASASGRRGVLIERIGPILLDEMSRLPDPDLSLMNLAAFIAAAGARTSFLELLEQHPATRRILLRLFASSAYLSTIFVRHPDMLDTLVRSDLAHVHRSLKELREELAGLVAACADFEARLDAIRAFRHQEFLRIAIADLAGDLRLDEVEGELSILAEAVLDEAMALATARTRERTAIPDTLRMCAIAMGRLGAGEMSYNSDLDLIFVYDDHAEVAAASREVASRIAQQLIAILESRTREGYAYKLDLRLRPSGNAGPLVTSLDGFRAYHRQSSAVWERQALVRARVVAGDAGLGQEVESARQEFVFGRSLAPAEVAEIAAMRARMEHEIGVENKDRLNIKQGPGGLVDVEFIVQMMALRHGCDHRELRVRDTAGLLKAIGRLKLVTPADARALTAGYAFLSQLENRLRIESDQPAWAIPTAPAALKPLARRMGYDQPDGAARLLRQLEVHRKKIRAIFTRCFAAEEN
ncbi:MAG TPA: bifunctional [glutamate--ammonia ligase]-adenylyl-L-tyrosine phosphorylase/[glutamate--ammonia-ligase] adenylyltransferase [Candidatus Binataceae bacterium]|nr:bifunctional [glutamate--ammonia ligase]-adenylyl-L-tyrosine phosphorylase/[glutamate--ammonia-ligase] adenylyltransferase [Candidatus Binataceae bacterium]